MTSPARSAMMYGALSTGDLRTINSLITLSVCSEKAFHQWYKTAKRRLATLPVENFVL